MTLALITWCWRIFFVVWIIAMFTNKRTLKRGAVLNRLGYTALFVLSAWLLLVPGFHHHTPLALVVLPPFVFLKLIAGSLTVIGLVLAIWARITLGRNWSGSVTFKENHELITRGPYAWVRHPIYTALLMMFLGTALALGKVGGLLGFPILWLSFWLKYRQEESLMIEQFGDQYRAYLKRVPAIIPLAS
jgi:protein-S-isoprenylcysteine O-methyltransferase Ste14